MENPTIILTPPSSTNTEWVVPEEAMYEAFIVDVEPVPNPWYESGQADHKKWQLKWTIQLDEDMLPELEQDGDKPKRYSTRTRWFTGTTLGKHPKNKLVLLCKAADPEFDLSKGYVDEQGNSSFPALKEALIGRYIRVVTGINESTGDDGQVRRYLNIASNPLRSSRGKVDVAKLLQAQTGGTTNADAVMNGDDLPY